MQCQHLEVLLFRPLSCLGNRSIWRLWDFLNGCYLVKGELHKKGKEKNSLGLSTCFGPYPFCNDLIKPNKNCKAGFCLVSPRRKLAEGHKVTYQGQDSNSGLWLQRLLFLIGHTAWRKEGWLATQWISIQTECVKSKGHFFKLEFPELLSNACFCGKHWRTNESNKPLCLDGFVICRNIACISQT